MKLQPITIIHYVCQKPLGFKPYVIGIESKEERNKSILNGFLFLFLIVILKYFFIRWNVLFMRVRNVWKGHNLERWGSNREAIQNPG